MTAPARPTEPHYHPSPETLTAYAAGTLRAGFDLVAAAHVRGCAHCQRELQVLEAVGGAVLAESDPVALNANALAQTLTQLDAPMPFAPGRTLDDVLAAAKKRWVAPGVWVAQVDTPRAPEDRIYLLSVKPGMATAKHGHSGAEFTLVLRGALSDDGIIYRAGDFTERDETDLHHPQAYGDEPCVCLFATHGRLAPAGILGQLAFVFANV